ncbi:MAG: hypothetical protein K0R61_1256 [Microvirga sp.]|nr:hypothetical protein [Microvirga sp.]
MEAVTPHAAFAHLTRQREQGRDVGLRVVEARVEAGNLRNPRQAAAHNPDRLQVVRLMQGRERHQLFERLDNVVVDKHRSREGLSAMNHPVPDGGKRASLLMLP